MSDPGRLDGNDLEDASSDSYSILNPGVRRALFQARNINDRREYRQSVHASMLGGHNAGGQQEVQADVHQEDNDAIPTASLRERQANSTEINGGRVTPRHPVPRNRQEGFDDIEQASRDDELNSEVYSTPSNIMFNNSATVPNVNANGGAPARSNDADLARLMERMNLLEKGMEREKQLREKAERERNEFAVLIEDAYDEQIQQRKRGENMEMYSLKDALLQIHPFAGEGPDELDVFIGSINGARDLLRPGLEKKLLKGILAHKIIGAAHKQLKHRTILTFMELKDELDSLFGKTRNIIGLITEFSNLRQRENEAVSEYVKRTEEITMDYLEAQLEVHHNLSQAGKAGASDVIRHTAKLLFEQGLQGQLQLLVRTNKYQTLHESCTGAIDLEKTINDDVNGGVGGSVRGIVGGSAGQNRNSIGGGRASTGRQSTGGCFGCGQSGHIARDCGKSQGGQRESLPVASERRSIAAFGSVCKFCKYAGHELSDCHKLKRALGFSENSKITSGPSKENNSSPSKPGGRSISNGAKERSNAEGDQALSLPVGSYQIMMVQPAEISEEDGAETGEMIVPMEPSSMKTQILLSASGLKQPTLFLSDSGARTSLIKVTELSENTTITRVQQILRGISNQSVTTLGEVILHVEIGDIKVGHRFQVVPANFPCVGGILGLDFLASPSLEVKTIHGEALFINGLRFNLYQDVGPLRSTTTAEAEAEAVTQFNSRKVTIPADLKVIPIMLTMKFFADNQRKGNKKSKMKTHEKIIPCESEFNILQLFLQMKIKRDVYTLPTERNCAVSKSVETVRYEVGWNISDKPTAEKTFLVQRCQKNMAGPARGVHQADCRPRELIDGEGEREDCIDLVNRLLEVFLERKIPIVEWNSFIRTTHVMGWNQQFDDDLTPTQTSRKKGEFDSTHGGKTANGTIFQNLVPIMLGSMIFQIQGEENRSEDVATANLYPPRRSWHQRGSALEATFIE